MSETWGVRRGLEVPNYCWAWYDWVVWPELGVIWLRGDARKALPIDFASHSYRSLLDHSGVVILGTYFGPSSSNRPTKMCYWLLDKLCHVQTSFCIWIFIQIVIRSNQPKFGFLWCNIKVKCARIWNWPRKLRCDYWTRWFFFCLTWYPEKVWHQIIWNPSSQKTNSSSI